MPPSTRAPRRGTDTSGCSARRRICSPTRPGRCPTGRWPT
nr:MAG TPA: hypothetical protein [Caudoviricetes sp.]